MIIWLGLGEVKVHHHLLSISLAPRLTPQNLPVPFWEWEHKICTLLSHHVSTQQREIRASRTLLNEAELEQSNSREEAQEKQTHAKLFNKDPN
jgi:hypothetical protein